jgi:hypothetical protein
MVERTKRRSAMRREEWPPAREKGSLDDDLQGRRGRRGSALVSVCGCPATIFRKPHPPISILEHRRFLSCIVKRVRPD